MSKLALAGMIRPGTPRRAAMRELMDAFDFIGIAHSRLDAQLLLCAAEEIEPIELIRNPEQLLSEIACERLSSSFRRRLSHEPVSRILGVRGFWSLDLTITPDVLDPRPESETLVEAAIEFFLDRQHDALRIADLGTGSGALLCALLGVFPSASGVGIDASKRACSVARDNLCRLGLQDRSKVINGEWSSLPIGSYELIVTNPPYIPTQDIETLSAEVRLFDPRMALDGGIDGLDAYRQIIPIIANSLVSGGICALEVGSNQAATVSELISKQSLKLLGVRADYGGNPRVVLAMPSDKGVR